MLSLDIVIGDLHLSVTSLETLSTSLLHVILSQGNSTTRRVLYLLLFVLFLSPHYNSLHPTLPWTTT